MKPKEVRSLLCLESECKFDNGCGCLTELMAYRDEIIEECAQELEAGLNVHRWIDLWTKDGRKIDEAVAIAFYHQALQDGWEALRAMKSPTA